MKAVLLDEFHVDVDLIKVKFTSLLRNLSLSEARNHGKTMEKQRPTNVTMTARVLEQIEVASSQRTHFGCLSRVS